MATELTLKTANYKTLLDVEPATNYESSTATMYCTWAAKQFLLVSNTTGAGNKNVTIDNPVACPQSVTPADHDEVHVCADAKITLIDLSPGRFRNKSDTNRINITIETPGATMKVCLVKLLGQSS